MNVFTCTLWIQAKPSAFLQLNLPSKLCKHPLKFQMNSTCGCALAQVHVKQPAPALQNLLRAETLSACSVAGLSS